MAAKTDMELSVAEKYRFAVLDVLIGNADRHALNFMRRPGGDFIAIDHGFSFNAGTENGPDIYARGGLKEFRSVPSALLRKIANQMPEDLRTRILSALKETDWAAFEARRGWLINQIESNTLGKRLIGYRGGIGWRPNER